jgi:hypothetical protein
LQSARDPLPQSSAGTRGEPGALTERQTPGRFAIRLSLASGGEHGVPPLLVPDARTVVQDFFQDQIDAWLFEAALRDPVNLSHPNQITLANWANLRLLAGDLASTTDAAQLDDAGVSEALQPLPPDADFFDSPESIRTHALAAANHLVTAGGLTPLAATALLYQKRPGLFPLVDRNLRLILGLPIGPSSRPRILAESFNRLAALGANPENQQAARRTLEWLGARPASTRYLSLTPVRLFSVLAASAAADLPATSSPERRRSDGEA